MPFVVLLTELLLLFLLSQWLTRSLYGFFLMIFRVRSVAVSTVMLLLFPGTVIHELSHLFTAEILGVPTGKLELAPESIKEKDIRTGSVAIAQTDPFRRALIGLAPIFAGIVSLVALSYFLPPLDAEVHKAFFNDTLFSTYPFYVFIALFYLLFSISNAMFSSPQDLKGCLPLGLTLGILAAAVYATGFRFFLTVQVLKIINRILNALTLSMGVVLAINIILLLVTNVLIVLTGKMTKTKIARR